MALTSQDTDTLKTQKQTNYMLRVFLIALCVSTIIFLPLIILNKGVFVYFSDFIYQQISFYQLCHNAIRFGETGFSLFIDVGTDFIGSYSSYTLGSPFFWITLPFPNNWLPYLMGPLLILKLSLTAVTGYCYIKMFVKKPNYAVIGGLLYAFCGVSIYNMVFNHSQEVVLLFPLLLICMENFVRKNQHYCFSLAVAICCIVNYQCFLWQFVFCIVYFLVRVNYNDFNVDLKKILLLVLETTIGVLLSCFLLVPSILSLLGDAIDTDIDTNTEYNYLSKENLLLNSYGFAGIYETDNEELLYIQLPYSKGFTAKINGEQVDILKANVGFMAVPVSAGVSEIEFTYVTPGLMLGTKLSAIGFIFFVFYIYVTLRLIKIIEYNINPNKKSNLIDLNGMTQDELNKFAMEKELKKQDDFENTENIENDE